MRFLFSILLPLNVGIILFLGIIFLVGGSNTFTRVFGIGLLFVSSLNVYYLWKKRGGGY